METKNFTHISKRGRAAYLILCFEEALKYYYGQNATKWRWLLNELWNITITDDIERWVKRICDAAPDSVFPYRTYQELIEEFKKIDYWYELSEKDFIYLRGIYDFDEPLFSIISSLYDKIYDVITLDWGELEEPYTPSCLSAIIEAEQILENNRIPFPQNNHAIVFIMNHVDKHYGLPFDGRQFSSLLSTESK